MIEDIDKPCKEWLSSDRDLPRRGAEARELSLIAFVRQQVERVIAGNERVLQHRTDICNDAIRVANDYATRMSNLEVEMKELKAHYELSQSDVLKLADRVYPLEAYLENIHELVSAELEAPQEKRSWERFGRLYYSARERMKQDE